MVGHFEPWNYGWSFFKTAMSEYHAEKTDELKQDATAHRIGMHAENKDWQNFLKS